MTFSSIFSSDPRQTVTFQPITPISWPWNRAWPSPNYEWFQTVTFQPIILSTMPRLTFIELWVVSREHLQRVWHACRERLPFRTPCFRPAFRDMLVLELLRPDSSNLACSRLFTLNTPWYFLDFALHVLSSASICQSWKECIHLSHVISIHAHMKHNLKFSFKFLLSNKQIIRVKSYNIQFHKIHD